MMKLGKKSKLGLGMMIAGGAMMTMGALVLKQGRKIDKEVEAFNEMITVEDEELMVPINFESDIAEEEIMSTPVEDVAATKDVLNMKDVLEEDNDIEYNPKAEHKTMTQAELEAQSNLGTF